MSEEDKAYYQKLLLINDLDNVIRKQKVYAAVTKPVLMDNEWRKGRDTVQYEIFTISEAGANTHSIFSSQEGEGWRKKYVTLPYCEVDLGYAYSHKETRIRTFSSQESFDKFLEKEIIYQHWTDRKNTKDSDCTLETIHECFGEREWFLVDFFDREGNMELVKEVKKLNEALKEAKKVAEQK